MCENNTKMIYILTIIQLLLVFCQQINVCNSIEIEDNLKTQFDFALKEAVTDLKTVLVDDSLSLQKPFEWKGLTVVTDPVILSFNDESTSPLLVRKVRDIKDIHPDVPINKSVELNLAHDFDPNFHTAFAMIGFTTILIAVSIFGISVSMWNLDPGKDSIIYRMTSQRIKKDQ